MKKTLYSLMLSDDVVREIDGLAHRQGTNRSALVNQILADYVDLITPERRIRDVFRQMEQILGTDRELVPYFAPNGSSISMKSSLHYRYRPTVRYSVELRQDGTGGAIGVMNVIFRTQSAELLEAMSRFFRLWTAVETDLTAGVVKEPAEYSLYDGRFTRTISLPTGQDYTPREVAGAISEYVRLFDRLMKGYIAGRFSGENLRDQYLTWLRQGNTII